MSAIHTKSLTGITSITTPPGVDNVFTVHSNDTTERFRVDLSGNQNISGIVTASTFSGSGASLTNLPAAQLSGTVPVARIGTGTKNTSTFYRGDGTFATVTSTTINNNADNRVITGSGTANTLNGESGLTFSNDGVLEVTCASNVNAYHKLINPSGYNNALYFESSGGTLRGLIGIAGGGGTFSHTSSVNDLVIRSNNHLVFGTGGNQGRVRIDSSGRMQIGTTTEGSSASDDLTIATSGTTGITIRSGTSNNGNIEFSDGTSGQDEYRGVVQYAHSDNSMRFYTNATEKVRITSGGHISQGGGAEPSSTNGAIGLKHGIKSSANNVIIGETTQSGSGYGLHIESRQTGRSGSARIAQIGMKNDSSGNGQISFFTSPSGADVSERMVINSSGYVGINQSSPQTGLHINQDWVNSYGSISVEGSANALVGLGLRSNGNYRASLIWRDGSSGNYLDIATYGAAYPILFRPNGTEKVRITGGGDLEMTGGTVSLKEHMVRVGNRTTSQVNAGVSTATGSLTLNTSTNNLLYYANAQWNTVKKIGNDGSTQQLAARSAKALLDEGFTTSGVYWLDMHGAYSSGNAKRHYCLMDSSYDGGGWTLLWCMNHGNNFASGHNFSYALNVGSNPSSVNDFIASNFGYDRRNTFTPQANDQFLIRRSDNNDWRRFVVTTWSPTHNGVSDGWSCTQSTDGVNRNHPYYAYGQMYDTSGNAVSGMVHFNGCAVGGNCATGGGDSDGFGDHINWSSGYSPYNCWGGAFNGQGNGGSPLYWGQTALSQGGSLYLQMFYRRTGTQ